MKYLLAAVAMIGVTFAAGCEPVKQRIIVHEDGRIEMGVTFILPDDREQLEKAAELGVPVTEDQAKAFFGERGFSLDEKGFAEADAKEPGFKQFTIRCQATSSAATSALNRVIYQKTGAASNEFRFEFDPALVKIEGDERTGIELPPQLKDQVAFADVITAVDLPGKVISNEGGALTTRASVTTVTWRKKLGSLMESDVQLYGATVRVLQGSNPGMAAWAVLLVSLVGLVLAFVMTTLQKQRAAGGRVRDKATRKHGHSVR